MAKGGKDKAVGSPQEAPRTLALAAAGIKTGKDFAGAMSALMCDLLEDRIDARTANAVCNAGGKLLKVVELQHKYGKKPADESAEKQLVLAP